MHGQGDKHADSGEASSSGRSSEEEPLVLQNGHAAAADMSFTEVAEDVSSAAPHLGSLLSADLDELPKGELSGDGRHYLLIHI